MKTRELFQTLGTAASLIFSLAAVVVAYFSFTLAQKADLRLEEDIGFSRIGCCSSLEIEYEDGAPIALYRDVEAYVSNLSLNPVTLVTCYEEGTSTWGLGGIIGNNCRETKIYNSSGNVIALPYRMDGGEVLIIKQKDSFPLRQDAIESYPNFAQANPGSDFIGFMCDTGLSLVTLASLQPHLNCLYGKEIEDYTRSWVRFETSRGNSFQSPDLALL